MSDTAAEAAGTARVGPTAGFRTLLDSRGGSSRMTTLNKNVVRSRNIMTRPLVLHGVFTAVDKMLAEPVEGEVGSTRTILRIFEASFRRLFLKFERFLSLRN